MKRNPPAELAQLLRSHSIQPSAQRLAIAECVFSAVDHPAADLLWQRVRERFPMVSRATVYNTLHLFAERGLVRELTLAEGHTVYDPKIEPHHHFIDDETGAISDVPWDALEVRDVDALAGFKVREYQVVLRGRRNGRRKSD